MSRSSVLSTSVLFTLLLRLINGAQLLKTTSLLFLSVATATAFAPSLTTVILP